MTTMTRFVQWKKNGVCFLSALVFEHLLPNMMRFVCDVSHTNLITYAD